MQRTPRTMKTRGVVFNKRKLKLCWSIPVDEWCLKRWQMLKPGQRSRTNKSAEVLCPSKTSDKLACFKILTCFPFMYRYSLRVLCKQRLKVILPFKSNESYFVNQFTPRSFDFVMFLLKRLSKCITRGRNSTLTWRNDYLYGHTSVNILFGFPLCVPFKVLKARTANPLHCN